MDNELRKKRVLEGIKMLEKGIDAPMRFSTIYGGISDFIGLSEFGRSILLVNGYCCDKEILNNNGFKYSDDCDIDTLLHNWKRFYELIKDLK